jgi:hypothetical protein
MRNKLPLITAMALLAAACSHTDDQGGNGPGNADGLGGRTDPPTDPAPASQATDPASHSPNEPGNTGNPPGETIRKPDADSAARQQ